MISGYLTYLLLVSFILYLIIYKSYRLKDQIFFLILLLSAAVRVLIGYYNITFGPLPGAEVDAVYYEGLAYQIFNNFVHTGSFTLELGREGYSSIISVAYLLGGRHEIFATFINIIFVTHFLYIVYSIVRKFSSKNHARLAVLLSSFYPTVLIYTSVPLREAPLMWGCGLFVYGLILYHQNEKGFFNWRIFTGILITTWLHGGFIVLLPVWAFTWLLKENNYKRFLPKKSNPLLSWRASLFLPVIVLILLGFFRFAEYIPKMPSDPMLLLDVEFFNAMRDYKASYGMGYQLPDPRNWLEFILLIPLMMALFLFSPTPFDLVRPGSFLMDATKMIDSILFFVMITLAFKSIKNIKLGNHKYPALILGITFLVLILFFSIGTANVGIAIRHRAKFAWLLIIIIILWSPLIKNYLYSTSSIIKKAINNQ